MTALAVSVFAVGNQPSNLEQDIAIPETLKILGDGEKQPEFSSLFRIITQKDGDKRIVWDNRNIGEINDAKKMFNDLVAAGMCPFVVDPSGKKSPTPMAEFDPHAGEVIFAPIKATCGG